MYREERKQLYDWLGEEDRYVEAKFSEEVRNEHTISLKHGTDALQFWAPQIIQYLDRARKFFEGASTYSGADKRTLEMLGQQALAKCFMTARDCTAASIRAFGDLPQPGHSSGTVLDWKRDSAT